MDFRRFQRFFKRERRQNGRNALGQHRLARPRRPDHQNVMSAGAGDFKGALGRLLAADVFEIHRKMLRLAQQRFLIYRDRENPVAGVYKMNDVEQGLYRINRDAADHGRFSRVHLRNHNARNLASAGFNGNW